MNIYLGRNISLLTILFFAVAVANGQVAKSLISDLKEDVRGPYKDIKWFCEDGSMREARDPCPEPLEGVQHARYKDNVVSLANKHHIYLDQILVGTDQTEFWDAANQHSRLKQYQITNFLFQADDGWILQKAKNYRGAKQIEDEQKWGQEFLEWAVESDARLKDNYLLLRMAAEDIPHGEDNRVSQRVRAYSKLLGDANPKFMDLRIKLHNNPSRDDLAAVKKWKEDHPKIDAQQSEYMTELITDMEVMYTPFNMEDIKKYGNFLPKESKVREAVDIYAERNVDSGPIFRAIETAALLKTIRDNIYETRWKVARIKLLDLSNHLEDLLMQDLSEYHARDMAEIREKICHLSDAVYGAGYVETWEYDHAVADLLWFQADVVALEDVEYYKYATQKLVQWSTQFVQSLYAEPIQAYRAFEPLVAGFTDDKIRSSVILPLGSTLEQLNQVLSEALSSPSVVMDHKATAGLQGLNPGFAKGELVVLTEVTEDMDLSDEKIYAFDRPPSDLKPVAGILNVKEGNPVSHVQLLARNLAIPNALINTSTLEALEKYNGKEVFYAVSPKGTVILKLAEDMDKGEKAIFKDKKREQKKVRISTDKIILHPDSLLDMSKIDASYSGKWCGPKAANLGQLKKMFPDNVVEGFVIPFGVFKAHMQTNMPGIKETYWTYLNRIFYNEAQMIVDGAEKDEIQCVTLQELGYLRSQILNMKLKKSLVDNIEEHFRTVLGGNIGTIPVFLRSDTNMEDLPEFTGAGLNLTLFNVLDRDKILQGIKEVWASPYTERSYQWRQQYLANPEDVYPSILIIPSVNVDRSGVIITTGVSRGQSDDISISFSRGVGGAVDGQSAESYVMHDNGYAELISPGRESKYRTIPSTKGSSYALSAFTEPVLDANQRLELYKMAQNITQKMNTQTKGTGPYDIELGMKDEKIWLFQVRPFVENKSASGSTYLKSIDPSYENKSLVVVPAKK